MPESGYVESRYTECRYAECRKWCFNAESHFAESHAECRGAITFFGSSSLRLFFYLELGYLLLLLKLFLSCYLLLSLTELVS